MKFNAFHQVFRSPGDEGGNPAPEPVYEELEDGTVAEVTTAEPAEVKPKFTTDDLEGFARENPDALRRFAPEPQQIVINQPAPAEPKAPERFNAAKFMDDQGLIDMDALGDGVQNLVDKARADALAEAKKQTDGEYLGTLSRLAARQLVDDLAEDHDLDKNARKYLLSELQGMTPKQIENLPARTRNILVNAAENVSRKSQTLAADDAAPGQAVRHGSKYDLSPEVPNPTGMTMKDLANSMGYKPTDKAFLDWGIAEGVIAKVGAKN